MADELEDERPSGPLSLRRTTIRGARLALIGYVASRAILFSVYVVLARLVTPADFGRYAAASVIVGVGSLFAESGMMSALIQRRDRIEEAASSAFYALLISGVLLALGALALSPVLGGFFRHQQVTGLAAALSPGMFLRSMVVVPDALLQRRFSFARRVAVDPLGAVGFAAASIAACAQGAGAWGLVAGSYASLIVQVVSSWYFAHFRPRRALASFSMWRELAGFARHVLGSEILSRIAGQLDALMLGRFAGAAALGQYRNGLRLAQQPSDAFVSVFAYVLLPALARLADDRRKLSAIVHRILGQVMATALPISLAFLPLGEPAAVLLLGPQWRPAGHAITALTGLLAGQAVTSVASECFKAVGRPQILVRVHFVSLISLAALVGIGAPTLGVVGVAAAVSISQLLTAAYALRRLASITGWSLRDFTRAAWAPAVAGGAMVLTMIGFAAALHPLDHPVGAQWALTVAQVLIGAVTYGALLLALDSDRRRSAGVAVRRLVLRGNPRAAVARAFTRR